MSKWIIIKCSEGDNGINRYLLSGVTLDDQLYVLGAPSRLAFTYNEFDNVSIKSADDLAPLLQDRRTYYSIICSDVSEDAKLEQFSSEEIKSFQTFADKDTPDLVKLPEISNSFCIYSHDKSLYSCACFRSDARKFIADLLNRVLALSCIPFKVSLTQESLEKLFQAAKNGIVIETEKLKITDNVLQIVLSPFSPETEFSDYVFPDFEPQFEYLYAYIQTKVQTQKKRKGLFSLFGRSK